MFFFTLLHEQVNEQIKESQQDMKYADSFFFAQTERSLGLLSGLAEALTAASDKINIYTTYSRSSGRRQEAADSLDKVSDAITSLKKNIKNRLVWIDRAGSLRLAFCPKNTASIISDLYFKGSFQATLTSATLTNSARGSLNDMYSYFINNTGFPAGGKGFLLEPKPSPYPYDEHAMIYYAEDLPHPTHEHEAFIKEGVRRLVEILNISHGKALVLFTAKTDMEEVYKTLTAMELPYHILMQSEGASQERLLEQFRSDTDSVLLGSGAFWEGISIEGKALSNVVIFRLPFPVPDPIIEDKTKQAKNALMDVLLPEMIIKLKQGIGRLIRNFTDTGIVSIIDPRLADGGKSPYRDLTWDALPIKNRTSDIKALSAFYQSLFDK